MLRFAVPALVVGAVVLFVPAGHAGPAGQEVARPGSPITNEPVVMFSIAGGTLTGTVHRQLTVYNSGFATIAKLDNSVFPTPGEFKDVETAHIGADVAQQLLLDLARAGAFQLGDQRITVSDVPLNTLTVLRGGENAFAHTFSYWLGFNQYGGVNTIIQNFIQKTFPGF